MILKSRATSAVAFSILVSVTASVAQAQQVSNRDSTAGAPTVASASLRPSFLTLVTSDDVDRYRADQLLQGVGQGQSLLMRSASSLTPSLRLDGRSWVWDFIDPQFLVVRNSGMPLSQNNSALWAGRGISTRTLTGIRVETPFAKITFAPQIIASENLFWLQRHNYFQPVTPLNYIGRGYTLPYYFYTFPIDHPLSFGERRIRNFDLGESTVMVSHKGFEAGASNENNWWGPGIRNAMLLSNNAPGFLHLFVRTGKPVSTPLGGIEMRWLVGKLEESRYFDTLETNNMRSLAAFAATLQSKWDPNLTVGVSRSVYATAERWEQIPQRWGDVFRGVTDDNPDILDQVWQEDSVPGGRDQLFTLFARWVFPASGAEVYGEWGRTRMPKSIASLLKTPNHTQGYTIGMQWRGAAWGNATVRLQAEITQLEQSATFRDGPVGSWYTSNRVIHGYTNRGHVIGASIGPGASSQFLAADYMRPTWQVGAFAGRIRWNEDVHGTYGFPEYVSYCNHDVSVYPGARGSFFSRFGSVSADLALHNRMNVFFQNRGGCPNIGDRLDLRHTSFKLNFSPSLRW